MQVNEALNSIQNLVSSLNTLKSTLNNTINSTKNNKLKDNVDSSVSKISAIKKALNFGAIYVGIRKSWGAIKNISAEYINMTETNNLFEVSMGKVVDQYGNLDTEASRYYTRAMEFQNEMNEKLLTNKKELKEYQAMYYSMLKSQGINKDKSYLMSESLTKAGYDIASLYNLSVDDAMDKLKSGLAGQVEPLRKIGIDISESSLNKVIREVGITNKNVQQLSYAEKEVARYIAILQQGQQAQGDFAKTMDNSANQIKIFKSQIAELKQVAGSFIMNTFGNILVYVNAVIMVLKEILKSFASLFGYDLESGGADLSGSTGVDDLNDGLGTAIGNAKKLKKQLMGFDEINNIDPNSKASGGSGNLTGIDNKLLNALKEWDNKMGSISGKAQEIRDRMLEWLGFERNDDGTWKLKEGLTNFEKILEVVKTIGIAILSWKVSKTITDLLANLGILTKGQSFKIAFGLTLALTGLYAQYKGTEHLLDGDIDLFTILETVLGTAGGAFGIASILKATKMGSTLTLKNRLKIGLALMLAIQGIQVALDGVGEVENGTITGGAILKSLAGALEVGVASAVAGLALSTSVLLTLDIVGVSLILMGHKMYENTVASVLVKEYIPESLRENVELILSIENLVWSGLEKIIPEQEIKRIIKAGILRIADWVEKIPVIGKSISEAIRIGVKASENETTNTIKYSTQEALENANPWVKTIAEKTGRETRQAYQNGFISLQSQTTNTIKNAQNEAIKNASVIVNRQAYNAGQAEGKSVNAGISNENLASGTNKLLNTARTTLNYSSMYSEGQRVGSTIRQGYSSNSISTETSKLVNTARTTLNKSNLNTEGQRLSKSINSGFNSVNFYNSGNNVTNRISNGINNSSWQVANTARNTAYEVNNNLDSNLKGYDSGANYVAGINTGIKNNKWNLWNTVTNLASSVMGWFKNKLGIHSPSREMMRIAKFIPEGIAKGIDDNSNTVFNSMKELSKGIKVNAQDIAIDTNQYVNYGTIKGQVQAQSNVSVNGNIANNVAEACYGAFCKAMRDEGIKVDIEAKTDEGTIVRKASQGFKNYVMQTGELPFPVPAG